MKTDWNDRMIPVDAHKATFTSKVVLGPTPSSCTQRKSIVIAHVLGEKEGEKTVIYNSAFGFRKSDIITLNLG